MVMCCSGLSAAERSRIFVDGTLATDSSTTYDPATRRPVGGNDAAFKTIKGASAVAKAGCTVFLRAGTYGEVLAPKHSGEADRELIFKAYENEKPLITGERLSPAVNLSGRQYVALEGLHVEGVRRWLYAVKSQHLRLEGNVFRRALDPGGSSKTGLFFQQSHYNRILKNTIDDSTQDNLTLIKSNHNLVEGNVFLKAKHVLWTIKGGCFNVLRCNYFHNQIQKIGEVYDCHKVGMDHEFTEFNCTKRNLIEFNVFAYTPSSGNHSPYSGIQYAGQDGIVRRNQFFDTVGPALSMTLYAEEARFNTGNRIAHNVFFKTRYTGVGFAGDRKDERYKFADNVARNNAFLDSHFQRNDMRWDHFKTMDGKPTQVMFGTLGGFVFDHNVLFSNKGEAQWLLTQGQRKSKDNQPPQTLAQWEAAHPKIFAHNLQADPKFTAPDKHDFRLQADSPCIDAGAFLTTAKAAGEGTQLPVEDARWFSDGMGVPGLEGDAVQFDGEAQPVRIVKVDIEQNLLTLATPCTWKAGQGVSWAFAGKAPDVGAFEHGTADAPPVPAAPPAAQKE